MASSISCTPLFFSDDPQRTGTSVPARVAVRSAARSSSGFELAVLEIAHRQLFIGLGDRLDQEVTGFRAFSA